jgi:hypothetical protein
MDLVNRFQRDGFEESSAKATADVLVSSTKDWEIGYVCKGDKITIDVVRVRREDSGATTESRTTTTHSVTDEPTQIIWLLPPS